MEWLFGKRMTPEEMLRKNKRSLDKAIRDLDRERMKMEQQEKKIIADIKKMAKDNQMVWFDFDINAKVQLRLLSRLCLGRCQNYGHGLGENETLRQEIHPDEGQHPGRVTENPDVEVAKRNGRSDEGSDQSHAEHEQVFETACFFS